MLFRSNYREDYREVDDEILFNDKTAGDEDEMHVLATDLRSTTPIRTLRGGASE